MKVVVVVLLLCCWDSAQGEQGKVTPIIACLAHNLTFCDTKSFGHWSLIPMRCLPEPPLQVGMFLWSSPCWWCWKRLMV